MTNNKKETTPKFENKYKYSRGDNSGQNTTKYKEFNDNGRTFSTYLESYKRWIWIYLLNI